MSSGAVQMFRKALSETVFFLIKFTKRLFFMQEGTCRFTPTCSQFTREALRELPLHVAIPRIIHRVSRCHPHGGFGHDPVFPNKENHEEKK